MFFFIMRRLLISIPILLASSFLIFGMVTISGDPLSDLRQRPNAEQLIAQRKQTLNLDEPFMSRYFDWLAGVIPFKFQAAPPFVEWQGFDFGNTREGQDVYTLLRQAMLTSLRLVLLATVLSIILGLVIGVITAARQYSLLDYGSTFVAFLCFSLPVFWLAVLLKEFGAIKFNDYLENPGISPTATILLSVLAALFWASIVGGNWRRRLTAGGIAGVVCAVLLLLADATEWLDNPGISIPVLAVLGLGGGVLAAKMFAPLEARPVLIAGVVSAAIAVVFSIVFDDWLGDPNWTKLLILGALGVGAGLAVGWFAGAVDRRDAMKAGATAAVIVGLLVIADRFMSAFAPGRIIGTIGPQTPNFEGTFWERMIDYVGHQILPTLALMLIGFATFMRFTRASMLETLNSDYVRTAKAKGLPADAGRAPPRFPHGSDPRHDRGDDQLRHRHRGCRHHRDGIRLAGHGPVVHDGPPERRPVSRHGVPDGRVRLDRGDERHRRHHVRRTRPEDPQ